MCALEADSVDEIFLDGKATLQVGFIGYFGYEMKRESLPGYSWSSTKDHQESHAPDAQFMFAQEVLRFDHFAREWKLFGLVRNGVTDPIASLIGMPRIGFTSPQFDDYASKLRKSMGVTRPTPSATVSLPKFSGSHNKSTYTTLIAQAKAAIKEGDSYEMTLTTKFRAHRDSRDCFGLYRSLRAKNPAPYSAFLNFPATESTIMSSSPERFISIDRCGIAEMKPIKGTVAVSKDPNEDARVKDRLATDVKELAENLMVS